MPQPPRRAPFGRVPWGWTDVGLVLGLSLPALAAAYLGFSLVEQALRSVGMLPTHGSAPPSTLALLNLIGDVLIYGAVVAVVIWVTVGRRHLPVSRLGLTRAPLRVLAVMPVVAIALQLAGSILTAGLAPLVHAGANPQVCQIRVGYGGGEWLAVLAVALVAPAAEELVFRGFLYGTLRQRMPWGWAAALSGLVFASLHAVSVGGYVLLLLPALFLAGVVLAAVYEWSRSLLPGMVVHASYNLIAVLLIFLTAPGAHCG
ncbi:MAG TPA: type II CAAX endopeptidase family protein [Verrucomicrobiae bacterium]|nr:type II CAAX endopeptidase family protein [Verrucomicrobiae bacterium]